MGERMTEFEDFPDDIKATAIREARFFADWLDHGNSTGFLSAHAVDGLADSIARALMSERSSNAGTTS